MLIFLRLLTVRSRSLSTAFPSLGLTATIVRLCGRPHPKVPAVGFAIFWVARNQTSIMGENRLMHLILLIELAMPSAAVRLFFHTESCARTHVQHM